jgi:hypothetical protein
LETRGITLLPDFLSHYYEANRSSTHAAAGPFRNLSDLPPEEAEAIQEQIRRDGNRFASRRAVDYLAMRYQDGKPYRGCVYTLAELPDLVGQFGLPQDWNPEGKLAPERYIEAQVWEDGPILNRLALFRTQYPTTES